MDAMTAQREFDSFSAKRPAQAAIGERSTLQRRRQRRRQVLAAGLFLVGAWHWDGVSSARADDSHASTEKQRQSPVAPVVTIAGCGHLLPGPSVVVELSPERSMASAVVCTEPACAVRIFYGLQEVRLVVVTISEDQQGTWTPDGRVAAASKSIRLAVSCQALMQTGFGFSEGKEVSRQSDERGRFSPLARIVRAVRDGLIGSLGELGEQTGTIGADRAAHVVHAVLWVARPEEQPSDECSGAFCHAVPQGDRSSLVGRRLAGGVIRRSTAVVPGGQRWTRRGQDARTRTRTSGQESMRLSKV